MLSAHIFMMSVSGFCLSPPEEHVGTWGSVTHGGTLPETPSSSWGPVLQAFIPDPQVHSWGPRWAL